MPWADFLNLLEGVPIHIPAPKSHYAGDILWDNDTSIFATSSHKICKYDGELNDVETIVI